MASDEGLQPPDDWLEPENLQRSLSSAHEFVRTSPVARRPEGGLRWPLLVGGLDGLPVTGATAPESLPALLDAYPVDSVAVVARGTLLLEWYRDGLHEQSLHLSMSVAKSIVGIAVGIAVERGLVDLGEPVTAAVPELRGSAYEGATVQHALDMVVSVEYTDLATADDELPGWSYDVACGWLGSRPRARGKTLLEFMGALRPASFQHGAELWYSSPNTDLLGLILERRAGQPVADLLSDWIWVPIGAETTARLGHDRAGTAISSSGFFATLRDYSRFGWLVAESGRAGDRPVVPAAWLDATRQGRSKLGVGALAGLSYHNHWWIDPAGRMLALGMFGQLICVDPIAQVVVVFLASVPAEDEQRFRPMQLGVASAICRQLAAEFGARDR